VILAAVIGTFVLGLGDQVSESAPQAQFTFDYDSTTPDSITVTHDGGDAIDASDLNVSVSGAVATGTPNGQYTWTELGGTTDPVSAGASAVVNEGNTDATDGSNDLDLSDSTIRVIWSSSNSDATATIGRFEA